MASDVRAKWFKSRLFPDGLALVAAMTAPAALYIWTFPRAIVLEDDGLFLMAGEHLGIAHPPGYPIYTLILHILMQLPVDTPAVLGHLLSSVFGAVACGAVMLCGRLLGASTIPALFAAWVFAASEHVWSQAIISEVYSFNALLFFGVYALVLHASRQKEMRLGLWLSASVIYGIGLANHWPLMVLATPGLLVALFPARRALLPRMPLLVGVATLTAALPYAWMAWRSHQDPLISFYGPIRVFGSLHDTNSLLFFIGRQGYSGVDSSATAGWSDRMAYLQWFGQEILGQLTLAGILLALLALILLLRERRWPEAGSGILVFLAHSVALILLLNFDFDYLFVAVFRPYSLVCYGLTAIWLSVGVQYVVDRHHRWLPSSMHFSHRNCHLVAAAAGLALVAWSVRANWQVNDRSDSDIVMRQAEILFRHLPDDAIMVAFGDLEVPPLGYLHFVEDRRPDITLISKQGLT